MMYKLALALLLTILFVPREAPAQLRRILQWTRVGIELGPSLVTLNHAEASIDRRYPFRFSYSGLLFADLRLNRSLRFQTGLRYTNLGTREEVLNGVPAFVVQTRRIEQHYASIPARLRLLVPGSSVYLFAGPEIAYLVLARMNWTYEIDGGPPFSGDGSRDITSSLQTLNVSLHGGAGLSFRFLGRRFYAQLQYAHGLTPTERDAVNTSLTQEIVLGIGHFF